MCTYVCVCVFIYMHIHIYKCLYVYTQNLPWGEKMRKNDTHTQEKKMTHLAHMTAKHTLKLSTDDSVLPIRVARSLSKRCQTGSYKMPNASKICQIFKSGKFQANFWITIGIKRCQISGIWHPICQPGNTAPYSHKARDRGE